jgi:hypothetical protein
VRRAVLALAVLAVATGCAEVIPGVGTPHDATAVFRPASMVADRETAAPGDVVELRFPDEMVRGILFVLEEEVGNRWVYRYGLMSSGDAGGGPGSWFVAGEEEDVGVPAIGVLGPGPDRVTIPPDASPGTWRICTGNAAENVCVRIEIADD